MKDYDWVLVIERAGNGQNLLQLLYFNQWTSKLILSILDLMNEPELYRTSPLNLKNHLCRNWNGVGVSKLQNSSD